MKKKIDGALAYENSLEIVFNVLFRSGVGKNDVHVLLEAEEPRVLCTVSCAKQLEQGVCIVVVPGFRTR